METVRFRLNDRPDAPEVLVELDETDVEIADEDGRLERVALGEAVLRRAKTSFSRTLETIPQVANTVLANVDKVDKQPDLVEFTMGFKVTGSGDLKLVAGSAEAHVTVRMEWSPNGKS